MVIAGVRPRALILNDFQIPTDGLLLVEHQKDVFVCLFASDRAYM